MRLILAILYIVVITVCTGFLGYRILSKIPYFVNEGILLWTVTISFVLVISPIAFLSTFRYQIPKPNTALIATNKSKNNVAFAGGIWVSTIIHKVKEIPLNRFEIKIVFEDEESCLTIDFNRCDVEVALYVKIASDKEDILKASDTFGDKLITSETIEELINPKVMDILRRIVAETESPDLIKRRQKTVEKMQCVCESELKINFGLTLEKLAIRRVYFQSKDWIGRCGIEGVPVSEGEKYPISNETTNCNYCRNEGARIYFKSRCFGKGETLLVVEDVPVIFCPNCREDYLSDETRQKIERIKEDLENTAPKRLVSVAVFEKIT